jgi:hypothetical protein
MFFGALLLRNGFDPFGANHHAFRELIEEAHHFRRAPNRDQLIEAQLAALVANSFPGIVSDPINAPDCLLENNLALVADACTAIIRQLLDEPAARRGAVSIKARTQT